MKLYSIRNWDAIYENNRSRQIERLSWVPFPNKHDGENYTKIMRHPDGAMIFSGFVLMVQIASKCCPRGVLIKGNGEPHNVTSMSLKSQAPDVWFKTSIEYLETNTDWLISQEFTNERQSNVTSASVERQACATEGKGKKEQKEGKGRERLPNGSASLALILEGWNAMAEQARTIPQCLVLSDKRRRSLEVRLKDVFFASHWQEAISRIPSSKFLTGQGSGSWKASFDWFIQPDSVAKIIEGKYSDVSGQPKQGQIAV